MMVAGEKSENMTIAGGRAIPCPPPAGIPLTERQHLLGAVDMRILRDGTWMHEGVAIRRPALVKLFASVLRRDRDGAYWLITPAEAARIDVEDAPLLAVEMRAEDGILRFRTNIDTWIAAGADRSLRIAETPEGEPRPYIRVADDGTEARLVSSVFYQLVDLAEERTIDGTPCLVVESGGMQFVLGPSEEA